MSALKTASSSTLICNDCLDGKHKCWPGDCACTVCSLPVKKYKAPARPRTPAPKPPKPKPAPLTPEMADYVARSLLEDAADPFLVSVDEWDAVHRRKGWTHREVSEELGITYERVRYVRRMARPEGRRMPSYTRIADRIGTTPHEVRKVLSGLVELRDATTWDAFTPPKNRPPEPRTFS